MSTPLHLTAGKIALGGKILFVAATTAVATTAAAIHWNDLVATALTAVVSSTISGLFMVAVAVYLKRGPLETIRTDVNSKMQELIVAKGNEGVGIGFAAGQQHEQLRGEKTAELVKTASEKAADDLAAKK